MLRLMGRIVLIEFAEGFDRLPVPRLFVLGIILFQIVKNDLAAAELEFERHLDEPAQLFFYFGLLRRRREQQKKSAAARAEQFSANRASRPRLFKQRVHLCV